MFACLSIVLPSLSHFPFSLSLSCHVIVFFLPLVFLVLFVLSCIVSLLLFHAKKNIKILYLKGSSHQCLFCFVGFLFLLSLSNPLLLYLLSPLAPAHPTLPLFVCSFLVFVAVCLFCVGFVFVDFAFFCLQKMSEKGRVGPLSTLQPALQTFRFRSGCVWAQMFMIHEGGVFGGELPKPNFYSVFG